MKDLLISHGAHRSWDSYEGYNFAMETVNGSILSFETDFQKKVFKEYLEYTGLTEEKVKEMLSLDYDQDEDEELPEDFDRYIEEDFASLGIVLKDNEIQFKDMVYEEVGGTKELLEELGHECSFEGEIWKLEMNGVYFIK